MSAEFFVRRCLRGWYRLPPDQRALHAYCLLAAPWSVEISCRGDIVQRELRTLRSTMDGDEAFALAERLMTTIDDCALVTTIQMTATSSRMPFVIGSLHLRPDEGEVGLLGGGVQ